MKETRIKISSIVENQLPQFVKEEFPLASEFLSQYYNSLESQGGVNDILQNIDQYINIDYLTNLIESTTLTSDVTFFDSTINVESTVGFPEKYGLILIDSEIITYTSKTSTSFNGCVRGFSGVTSYKEIKDQLTFTETESQEHKSEVDGVETTVTNLSVLFLKEFLVKIKKQITPGFENRELYSNLNEKLFIKQSIDFYSSKGTDNSFKILFGALYGEKVQVIKPRDYLIQPSDAEYRITKDIVVKQLEGDINLLVNTTIYQDKTDFINEAVGTVSKVEKIFRGENEYFILSLDYGYQRDIGADGTIFGEFSIHPATKIITAITDIDPSISGFTTSFTSIDVDSTVGFPNSGELVVIDSNGIEIIISYKDKTLNQFLDCTGINQPIDSGTEIRLNTFAYGKNNNELIKFYITGVLSDLVLNDTKYQENNFPIKIKTLGSDIQDHKANNWFFNHAIKYTVKSISIGDLQSLIYDLEFYDDHSFVVGDKITAKSSTGVQSQATVVSFNNKKSITIKSEGETLSLDRKYEVIKNLSRVNSLNYPELSKYTSNVQNVYVDSDDHLYVASPSLPTYLNQPLNIKDKSVTFSGSFSGTEIEIGQHPFYTGDWVYYRSGGSNNNLGIPDGYYFIKKVNESSIISLARSKSDIFFGKFVSVNGSITNNKIEIASFIDENTLVSKKIEPQKIIRKIENPKNSSTINETKPGTTGILINGVEILNYKSEDSVFYGPIENIRVLSPGENYDIINPPVLEINDSVGYGATAYCSIKGSLKRIDVIDGGFDYIEDPVITISGGNGKNAIAKANLISFDHHISFNSDSSSVVNVSSNIITFSEYHKFRDNELVIYDPEGQTSVGGLTTNSQYYVSVQNDYSIKLYNNFEDSSAGINTIFLTSIGKGVHRFKSIEKKKKIGSISIENSGADYCNKKIIARPSDINISLDTISIKNHGYETGEIIKYSCTSSPITGLSTSNSYYVIKIDENNFRLTNVGIGETVKEFFLNINEYIDLQSIGSGLHIFNYEPITVNVFGKIGISTLSGQNFNAVVQPIFRGNVDSVFVQDGGYSYGSEDILNYNRQPEFVLKSGSNAQLTPIVNNGKIVNVIVNSGGENYNSPPDLVINGSGYGAIITPIISNGSIISVKIISEGIGYLSGKTTIDVIPAGSSCKLDAKIKSWRINLFEKLIRSKQIVDDDGIPTVGLNEFGLQYTHLYPPRKLRSSVFGTRYRDGQLTYESDLILDDKKESESKSHSPIIGWAYDGNPIYGPYGYSEITGGSIRSMISGYEKVSSQNNRPSEVTYPLGFFVEDYVYTGIGDLDEHNGRFCITPEYPNGVYAYFSSINNGPVESGSDNQFKDYKKPIFPYFIGNTYKSIPIDYNFERSSNQKDIDVNKQDWLRNTTPYKLNSKNSGYDYIFNPNKVRNQTSIVKLISSGNLSSVGIITGGTNYKINDEIIFDIPEVKAKVHRIKGKSITEIAFEEIEVDNIQLSTYNSFVGIATSSHNLSDGDLISFTSKKEFKNINGKIKIVKNNLSLISSLPPASVTGIITDVTISGNLDYPYITENTLFQNGDEIIKVLDIDRKKSIVKIEREQFGSLGLDTSFAGSKIVEKSNKFIVDFGISTNTYNFDRNKQIYFEADKYVGLGTQYGVGITSTIFVDVSKFRSKVSIGTGSTTFLYFVNSKESKKYKLKDYVELVNSTDPLFNVSRKQVISVGSTFIKIDFDSSSLSGLGVTAFVNRLDIIKLPTKGIRLPKHKLKSDDPIIYRPPTGGNPISISTDGISPPIDLPDDIELFPIVIDEDTIGISTKPNSTIDDGFFFVNPGSNDLSSGEIHSFETNYSNSVVGKVIKKVVTVTTDESHGLTLSDEVIIDVKSGISTTIFVKFNDFNRRSLINSRYFSTIDVENNIIPIENHGFYNGQKVLYTSNTPSSGLTNEKLYYVVVLDDNNIRLSNNYYDSIKEIPIIVNILSSNPGYISPINPPVKITKNQNLIFDLSDSSLSFSVKSDLYPAFQLNFYTDPYFKNKFEFSQSNLIEIIRNGIVGVDTTAKVTLRITDTIPNTLYYKLDPINVSLSPENKKGIIVDNEVLGYNQIIINESIYNGKHRISGISSNTFQFIIEKTPEEFYYNSNNSILSYYTESKTAKGSIFDVKITSPGKYLKSLPQIVSIDTEIGSGAILEPISNNIGSILKTEIQDIGFDYSQDFTIKPIVKTVDVLKISPQSSIKSVGISSAGKGYSIAPDLVVLDGLTKEVISDLDLKYDIENGKVEILKNTKGINNVTPIIIPTNNINGIDISNITFNSVTKNVVVTLGSSFSDVESLPFKIGDKVFIENVSVGVGSTGLGYNSKNYNYSLFTINNVGYVGGITTVSYNMSDYLPEGKLPGTFDIINSSGQIIPQNYFPSFDIKLEKNNFLIGEDTVSSETNGTVVDWDSKSEYLKISTTGNHKVGDIITGNSSQSRGVILSVSESNGYYNVSSGSIVKKGWNKETGFTNNQFQRIHDNDYYQYFSYALRSKVPFEDWNSPVSSLNHTVGFKKFSDLIIESYPIDSGISTTQNNGDFSATADLSRVIDVNCIHDFDLVTENNLNIDQSIKSDQIIFNSRLLQDYIESIGNRVLSIDDISDQFNDQIRPTQYSVVDTFRLDSNTTRSVKYLAYVRDKRYTSERQINLITLVQDGVYGYINQYGFVDTQYDMGSFDFSTNGIEGNLLFYPTRSTVNNFDVSLMSIDINDSITSIGSTSLGDIVFVGSSTTSILSGTSSQVTVVGISSTYRSSKILVQIGSTNSDYFEYNELTLIHDGSEITLQDYGQLTTNDFQSYSSTGLGTYYAYYSGQDINIDLIPYDTTDVQYNINSVRISIGNSSTIGISTEDFDISAISSNYVSISSSPSPGITTISSYSSKYQGAYYIVSVEDLTNSQYEISEIIVINDNSNVYLSQFGVIQTNSSIGLIGATVSLINQQVDLTFTPNTNTEVQVRVYQNAIGVCTSIISDTNIDFVNAKIRTKCGEYEGSEIGVNRSFNLTHNQLPIFERYFDSSDSSIVDVVNNTIEIPDHFFVTGEKLKYSFNVENSDQAIGIATTTISGIGLTDKLPGVVYAVKDITQNDRDFRIKLAGSASDALKVPPKILDITSVGIGTSHGLTSVNQNTKVLITLDNIIQSPIVSTSITSKTTSYVNLTDEKIYFSNVNSFYSGDIIRIGDEIMKIESITGIGTTNYARVKRPWFGTGISTHSQDSTITKVIGDYNIVDNIINFQTAPKGLSPISSTTNPPDSIDFTGLQTSYSFGGRVFIRSGIPGGSDETYNTNYVLDDISPSFNGITSSFTLKSNSSDVVDVSNGNAVILINDIFQIPENIDYELTESGGSTSIRFTGSGVSVPYDVNTGSLPRGGVIVSISSTEGFGYQPLVSAGGTAIVSAAGSIQSISIGNSGSGYRVGIQTIVNVGVVTSSLGTPNIEFIGTASISGGHIVSVAITNPGTGYTSSNPPIVIFDDPLSYSHIPLIYSSSPGIGTNAYVDIIVSQDSSVLSFEITNNGYGYEVGETLTIESGGSLGIPTYVNGTFKEFQITVDEIFTDEFSGWTIGDLQLIDSIDFLFDGVKKVFPIKINGNQTTIRAKPGSPIEIKYNLLVFVNNILQIPDKSYVFDGGSRITFNEAPKPGDTCKILFYGGTSSVDTLSVDILETVKVGDFLTINSDTEILKEDPRLCLEIISTDVARTNVYPGPGISQDNTIFRPVTWCKQTVDKIINGQEVSKARISYEPLIQPTTNIIQSVGTSSTEIFVESVKTFFDSAKEYEKDGVTEIPQRKIVLISQDSLISAEATPIVSTSGTITSIMVTNGGFGYANSPLVTIENPIGLGVTQRATASSTISGIGSVTQISIINPGTGYTSSNPPTVFVEPPSSNIEIIDRVTYEGDFGIISGIQTVSVGVASTGIIFDFYIPKNSYLRDSDINPVGIGSTVSGIQTGYYFVVFNSNVGYGLTSLNQNGSIVGYGSTFIDNIYQVASVSIGQTNVIGIGLTYVARVTVSVQDYNGLTGIGYSNFYGEYSWGRITNLVRTNPKSFTSYNNGIVGISTSPIVQRYNPLKYQNYST